MLAGSPGEILYALSLIEASDDRAIHPAVRALVKHESADVRQHALRILARAGDLEVLHDVERLLYDEHLEVRTEALLYLTEHGHVDPLERIEQLGHFEDFSLRAAMAAFLARPGRAQNLDAAHAIIGAMVGEAGAEGQRARIEAGRLLGMLPDVFDRELGSLLQDPNPEVAAAAIRAVGLLRKRPFVGRIIERLGERALTEQAVATLAGFDDAIVGVLRDTLVDDSMPVEIRREIPLVLQAIGTRASQFALMENLLDNDAVTRHRIITALNKLGQQHPDRRIDRKLLETVLTAEIIGHYRSYQVLSALDSTAEREPESIAQALADGMQQEAERIFRILKMLYPDHDMHSAYVGLESEDPVVHDNAVEFLEAVLPPYLRTQIIPLFDRNVSLSERGRIAQRLINAPVLPAPM